MNLECSIILPFEILIVWIIDRLKYWLFEILIVWNINRLKYWSLEILIVWNIDRLKYWSVVILIVWPIGSLNLCTWKFKYREKNPIHLNQIESNKSKYRQWNTTTWREVETWTCPGLQQDNSSLSSPRPGIE